MFIQVIIFIIFAIIAYIIIKKYFRKIYISTDVIKYKMNDSDKDLWTKYSNLTKINKIPSQVLFYTNSKWNSRNNNYILSNNRYYIIEPGYYYYLSGEYTITSNDIDIFSFNFEKWNNKIEIKNTK